MPATPPAASAPGSDGSQPAGAEELDLADTDEVLDILRAVESVEVVLLVRELIDGTCKLSARAKHDYPVNELAARFGGGGHRKAAGATLSGPLALAKRAVVDALLADFRPAPARETGA